MKKKSDLRKKWDYLVLKLSEQFSNGNELKIDGIVYLIGIQELGKLKKNFKKNEKINIIHIAICKLLEPYGYYKLDFYDKDGWPHYKNLIKLPNLKPGEQTILIKEAIVNYFEKNNYF